MDVAAIVLSALTCFFILMGNFKSPVWEKSKKNAFRKPNTLPENSCKNCKIFEANGMTKPKSSA